MLAPNPTFDRNPKSAFTEWRCAPGTLPGITPTIWITDSDGDEGEMPLVAPNGERTTEARGGNSIPEGRESSMTWPQRDGNRDRVFWR